jgi:hypothetical protein
LRKYIKSFDIKAQRCESIKNTFTTGSGRYAFLPHVHAAERHTGATPVRTEAAKEMIREWSPVSSGIRTHSGKNCSAVLFIISKKRLRQIGLLPVEDILFFPYAKKNPQKNKNTPQMGYAGFDFTRIFASNL